MTTALDALTADQIRTYAASAGFTGAALDIAVAVALAESSGRPAAIGDRDLPHRGCRSYGLWQINSCPARDARDPVRRGADPAPLLDPAVNAAAAWSISSRGTNWRPWTTYRTGAYRRYMPQPGAVGPPALASLVPIPPIPDPTLGGPAGTVIAGASEYAAIGARLVSWDTWRRVLYVIIGLGAAGAGLAIITRDTIAGTIGEVVTDGNREPAEDARPSEGTDDGAIIAGAVA